MHKTTQQDGHYRANPSNHELLTVRGVDCCVSKRMFGGLIPPYYRIDYRSLFFFSFTFLSLSKPKANRTELHPKVRLTCSNC